MRELDLEGGTAAGGVACFERAALVFNDLAGDREAEAEVRGVRRMIVGACFVGSIKTFEEVWHIFCGDAWAVVLDDEKGVRVLGASFEADVCAVRGSGGVVLDGVGDEVGRDEVHRGGVGVAGGVGERGGVDFDVAGLGEGGELAGGFSEEVGEIGGRARIGVERGAGGFLAGEEEEGFDEVAHAGGGFAADLEGVAVLGGGAVAFEDALGFGDEDGNGGA